MYIYPTQKRIPFTGHELLIVHIALLTLANNDTNIPHIHNYR